MKISKRILAAGLSALTAAALMTGCMSGGADAAKQAGAQSASSVQAVTTAAVVETQTPQSDAAITFSDSGAAASGAQSGFEIDGTRVTITDAGVYTLTGACADGSVSVKKEVTGVTLVLDGLTLGSGTGAPITVGKGSEVTLLLIGESTLTDAEDPADEESADAAVADAYDGAAVKVKAGASLTIAGDGALTVNGNAKNGIKSGEGAPVTITGGTLTITAVNDAVNAGGDLTVTGGTLTIDAGDDALTTDGVLTVGIEGAADGPVIDVRSSYEGFEGAQIVLNAGSGSIRASDDGVNAASDTTNDVSITVNGGDWYIDADGDGLDAGGENNRGSGSIVLNGGTVTVFGAANDGNGALDSESGITYNGGTLLAVGMSGMAEAPSGGSVLVFGGMGGMGGMGGPGGGQRPDGGQNDQPPQMPDGGQNGQPPQMPDGGQNGQPPQMPDGGQSGQFPQRPDGGQNGQRQNGGETGFTITAGSKIAVAAADGTVVCEAVGVKNANSVVFASAAIVEGETYTLRIDGEAVATAVAGEGGTGGFGGGMPGGPNGGN